MTLESATQAYAGELQNEIDRLTKLRDSILSNGVDKTSSKPGKTSTQSATKPKFTFSAAQKKKISDALKKRWANIKKAQKAAASTAKKPASKTPAKPTPAAAK